LAEDIREKRVRMRVGGDCDGSEWKKHERVHMKKRKHVGVPKEKEKQ